MNFTHIAAAIAIVLASPGNAAEFEYQPQWTFKHTEANGSKAMGS
jgi:hypothetical protein